MVSEEPRIAAARERVGLVRAEPGYLAFCSLIGQRLEQGNRLSAHRMLVAIGAPPAIAHLLLERWPTEFRRRLSRSVTRMWLEGELSVVEEAALRLSFFLPAWRAHDWPALVGQAALAAQERAAGDGPQGPPRRASSPPG